MNPRGPLRHKKIDTNNPTTTGGRPIPVLIKATAVLRPGNLMSASAMPKGTPSKSEMKVALPEILSESQVIAHTSASKLKTSWNALAIPCQISSTLGSELFFFLAGYRDKQRLAEFLHAEVFDHILRLRRYHKVCERFATHRINPWTISGINLHHRINVQKRFITFDQNGQSYAISQSQQSTTVGNGVGIAFVGDVQGRSHSLACLDVPVTLGRDPRLLPQHLLKIMRARIVTPRHERGFGLLDELQRCKSGFRRFDLRWVIFRADNHEIVVHDQTAVEQLSVGDVLFLQTRRMDQRHIGIA